MKLETTVYNVHNIKCCMSLYTYSYSLQQITAVATDKETEAFPVLIEVTSLHMHKQVNMNL